MGANSKIAWTDHTFNSWWGCTKVSAGCKNCYAEGLAKRFGTQWGLSAERRLFGQKHWNEPLKWNRDAEKAGERTRVFCGSMMDLFEDAPGLEVQRAMLWTTIMETPMLDWLLLTKRPDNIRLMLPLGWIARPRSNVAFGLTVCCNEDTPGIETLLRVPAAMRFLSMEPLLEHVELKRDWIHNLCGCWKSEPCEEYYERRCPTAPHLDWVIVGGESGPNARPFHVEWAKSLIQQCHSAGVACFVKQLGTTCVAQHPMEAGAFLRIHLNDRAGADPDEWSDDLKVRELPQWKGRLRRKPRPRHRKSYAFTVRIGTLPFTD